MGLRRNIFNNAADNKIVRTLQCKSLTDGIFIAKILLCNILRDNDIGKPGECRIPVAFDERESEHRKNRRVGKHDPVFIENIFSVFYSHLIRCSRKPREVYNLRNFFLHSRA